VDPLFALQTLILGQCFGFPPKFLRSSAAKNSFGFLCFFSFGCFLSSFSKSAFICVHLRSSAAKKFFRLSKFLFFWLFLGLSHTEFFSRLTSFNNEEKVRIPLTNARAQVSVLV